MRSLFTMSCLLLFNYVRFLPWKRLTHGVSKAWPNRYLKSIEVSKFSEKNIFLNQIAMLASYLCWPIPVTKYNTFFYCGNISQFTRIEIIRSNVSLLRHLLIFDWFETKQNFVLFQINRRIADKIRFRWFNKQLERFLYLYEFWMLSWNRWQLELWRAKIVCCIKRHASICVFVQETMESISISSTVWDAQAPRYDGGIFEGSP